MLGFILGSVTVWAFLRRPEMPPSPPAVEADATAEPSDAAANAPATKSRNIATLADKPSISVVEAIFEQSREYAFWFENVTQIAIWNSVTGDYTDFFEVYRTRDATYFRPLDKLTWWRIDGYGPDPGMIRFAETNEMRLIRYRDAGVLPESHTLPPPPPPRFNLAP